MAGGPGRLALHGEADADSVRSIFSAFMWSPCRCSRTRDNPVPSAKALM
jgi:hypothetical protein